MNGRSTGLKDNSRRPTAITKGKLTNLFYFIRKNVCLFTNMVKAIFSPFSEYSARTNRTIALQNLTRRLKCNSDDLLHDNCKDLEISTEAEISLYPNRKLQFST